MKLSISDDEGTVLGYLDATMSIEDAFALIDQGAAGVTIHGTFVAA